MNVSSKYELVEKIINSDNDDLLNEIMYLLKVSDKDFWHELPSEITTSIQEAADQLDKGEGIRHEEVMNEIRYRFPGKK